MENKVIAARYNLDQLITVRVKDRRVISWYKVKKEKKFLGFVTQKAGIYLSMFSDSLVDALPPNLFIENDIVYEKPRVVMCFNNDYIKEIHFNSVKDANDWVLNQNEFITNRYFHHG